MKIHVTAESTCIIIGPYNDFDESENTVDSRDSGEDFAKVTYCRFEGFCEGYRR